MSVREMETKLNGVLNRHKDANPTQLMNHNRLGFKPEDKKAVDQHAQSGGDKHEVSLFVLGINLEILCKIYD